MSLKSKSSITWEEWQMSRKVRRAITEKISTTPCRRRESSADKRLLKTFDGKRAPSL